MKRAAIILSALLVTGVACPSLTRTVAPYKPEGIQTVGEPQTGRAWYQRDCAWCHGDRGAGTPRGPSLITGRNGAALTDYMIRTGRMPIQDPAEPVRRKEPVYSPEVIQRIVSYVASLGGRGPAVPDPRPEEGDLAEGHRLYAANCAACHSATGVGGTLTEGRFRDVTGRGSGLQVPGLSRSEPIDVAEAMRTGPGTMPVFGEDAFTDEQVNSIIAYVERLRAGENPGGGDLGRVGPVAEGAIAWVVGLGALIVLARVIGKAVGRGG